MRLHLFRLLCLWMVFSEALFGGELQKKPGEADEQGRGTSRVLSHFCLLSACSFSLSLPVCLPACAKNLVPGASPMASPFPHLQLARLLAAGRWCRFGGSASLGPSPLLDSWWQSPPALPVCLSFTSLALCLSLSLLVLLLLFLLVVLGISQPVSFLWPLAHLWWVVSPSFLPRRARSSENSAEGCHDPLGAVRGQLPLLPAA